jgi:hypothetical protein
MASTLEQDKLPNFWSSNSDDIVYEFAFKKFFIQAVSNDGGKVKISPPVPLTVTYSVGDEVFIESNLYNGIFKITKDFGGGEITIDANFAGSIASLTYFYRILRVPNFDIYKGFKTGEDFDTELPYAKLVSIKPTYRVNTSTSVPYVSFNLKGILKYAFNIDNNVVANSIDFSSFNAIRIEWDGNTTNFSLTREYTLVLNCGLTNLELQEKYTGQGFYLIPTNHPVLMSNGVSFCTYFWDGGIINNYPVIHKFINGVKV